MKNAKLRIVDYLDHIVEAAERIQKYTHDLDEDGFQSSELIQDAVIRNFEIIGEASSNIQKTEPGFIASHPTLPLRFAYDMRNQLSHGYFSVDFSIVWRTAKTNIPALCEQVKSIAVALRKDKGDRA